MGKIHQRHITIDIRGMGKQRPRRSRSGGMFTPSKTKEYEDIIAGEWIRKYGNAAPFSGAILVEIYLFYKIPKSRKDLKPGLPMTSKPDRDNADKAISDALNGVAYEDDKLSYASDVKQYYHGEDKIFVRVTERPKDEVCEMYERALAELSGNS